VGASMLQDDVRKDTLDLLGGSGAFTVTSYQFLSSYAQTSMHLVDAQQQRSAARHHHGLLAFVLTSHSCTGTPQHATVLTAGLYSDWSGALSSRRLAGTRSALARINTQLCSSCSSQQCSKVLR
jgi:hypothetical protein